MVGKKKSRINELEMGSRFYRPSRGDVYVNTTVHCPQNRLLPMPTLFPKAPIPPATPEFVALIPRMLTKSKIHLLNLF